MSSIEWTDETWNPVVGCSEVSPGCDHCYAVGVAHRAMQPAHEGLTIRTDDGIKWNGKVRCLPERLDTPLRWRKPRKVFVNSMSDLFHPDVPDEFVGAVYDVMVRTPQHTYQILTKRPQRMARVLGPNGCGFYAHEGPVPCPQPNVWLGTSVESEKYAFRIRHLQGTPAAVRFLSLEPLLGPVNLTPWLRRIRDDAETEYDWDRSRRIDWVIVGGESGTKARPMDPDWVRSIRDECQQWGVPFFFKQWGGPTPKAHGRTLDGRTHDEYPTLLTSPS